MVLRMARPTKVPGSNVWYLRQRVPVAERDLVRGKALTIEVAVQPVTIRPTTFYKVSQSWFGLFEQFRGFS